MIRTARRHTDAAGNNRRGGFTLIELIVVIAIIGIIVGIASGQYRHSITKAKEATLKEDLYIMRTAINQYFADKGRWPADLYALEDDEYIYRIPVDPMTKSADTWIPIYSEFEDTDISTEPGIVDVKSGAEGYGLDGTAFGDW